MKAKILFLLFFLTFNFTFSKFSNDELAARYLKLGNTYLILNDLDNSYKYLIIAYNLVKGKNNYWEAVALEYIGYYFIKKNDIEKAIRYLNNSQLLYQSIILMDNGSQEVLKNILDKLQFRGKYENIDLKQLEKEIDNFELNLLDQDCFKGIPSVKNEYPTYPKVLNYDNKKLRELPNDIDKSVVNLSLANNKIREFPQGLLNLTNLEFLNLENNKIKSIPDNINKLKNLKYLNLSNNKLKSIPSTLVDLKNLKLLDLTGNKIPFTDIANLLRAMPNTNILFDEFILKPETTEENTEEIEETIEIE